MFLTVLDKAVLFINSMPETLALLIFGVSLVAATFGLRRLLKRHEHRAAEEKALTEKKTVKH